MVVDGPDEGEASRFGGWIFTSARKSLLWRPCPANHAPPKAPAPKGRRTNPAMVQAATRTFLPGDTPAAPFDPTVHMAQLIPVAERSRLVAQPAISITAGR